MGYAMYPWQFQMYISPLVLFQLLSLDFTWPQASIILQIYKAYKRDRAAKGEARIYYEMIQLFKVSLFSKQHNILLI